MIKLTDEMHQFLDNPPGDLSPCIISRLVDSGVQSDPSVQSAIVYLKIDQILSLYGEILQERNPGLEW